MGRVPIKFHAGSVWEWSDWKKNPEEEMKAKAKLRERQGDWIWKIYELSRIIQNQILIIFFILVFLLSALKSSFYEYNTEHFNIQLFISLIQLTGTEFVHVYYL